MSWASSREREGSRAVVETQCSISTTARPARRMRSGPMICDRLETAPKPRKIPLVRDVMRFGMCQLLAAMGIAAIVVVVGPLGMESRTYDSIDWLTLTSERIAVGGVVSSTAVPLGVPDATHQREVVDARVSFRVLEWLRGGGSRRDSLYWHGGGTWGLPTPGDSVIVFWQLRILIAEGRPETLRTATALDLTRLNRGDRGNIAFTNDYHVFRSAESVLRAVRERVALVESHRPLGDQRRLDVMDFAARRGALNQWMPPESEAQRATGSEIINDLVWPADARLLPALMRTTHDSSAYSRGWAATGLAEYPAAQVVPRLREMLADGGTELVVKRFMHARDAGPAPGGGVDSVWTAPVQFYARHSLEALGADTARASH